MIKHHGETFAWMSKNILPRKIDKIRIGCKGDGGYIIPTQAIQECDLCVSYGLGKNIKYEQHLIRNNKFVIGYDILKNPSSWSRILKLQTYSDFANIPEVAQANKILLKIDTEGAEWGFFSTLNSEHFSNKVHTFAFELHLHKNPKQIPLSVLEKILDTHHVVHVHANNYCKYIDFVPVALEITMINKKYSDNLPLDTRKYPLPNLDFPNYPSKKDIKIFWLH